VPVSYFIISLLDFLLHCFSPRLLISLHVTIQLISRFNFSGPKAPGRCANFLFHALSLCSHPHAGRRGEQPFNDFDQFLTFFFAALQGLPRPARDVGPPEAGTAFGQRVSPINRIDA
jgi:hypothetical protein